MAKAGKVSGSVRARPDPVRNEPKRDAGRAVAKARELPPLARLVQALRQEGISFQIAGMSAAILQGVPATTLDTDIWVALPERRFVRLTAIVIKLGGTMLAPTVAALADDSLVNFLPRIDGLQDFAKELPRARKMRWLGFLIPVLPLESLLKSKEAIRRPKDIAHIPLLREVIRLRKNPKR